MSLTLFALYTVAKHLRRDVHENIEGIQRKVEDKIEYGLKKIVHPCPAHVVDAVDGQMALNAAGSRDAFGENFRRPAKGRCTSVRPKRRRL